MRDAKEIQRVFLIADLSGYTALTEAHGNISAANVVKRFVEMVQEILDEDAHLFECAKAFANRPDQYIKN